MTKRSNLAVWMTPMALAMMWALMAFVRPAGAQPTDLLISEYVEGSSNNKAIEIYNGTGATIDLTAGVYNIQVYSNGSPTATTTTNLTGAIADGAVFIIAHTSAVLGIVPNQTSGNINFNGNDAVVLRKGGASGPIVDVIGQVGFNPVTEWGTGKASTADNTLRRNPDICAGDTNPSDAFDPGIEWAGFPTDTFGGLGAHTTACAPAIVDCITYTSPHARILEVTIAVVDGDDNPLAGASVTIHLTGTNGVDITATGVTGANGAILFTRRITAACYTTDVTNIVLSGYTFDGAEPVNGHQKNVDATPDADCRSASDLCNAALEGMSQDCPDIDESGTVDVDDLLAIVTLWGPCPGCPADITGNTIVNVDDLLAVISKLGACP